MTIATATMELFPLEIQGKLIARFPEIEPSYETISSKIASSTYNFAMAIPTGPKYYAWFSYHRADDVIYFMELTKNKKIGKIYWTKNPYGLHYSYGTILYGTMLQDGTGSIHTSPQFMIEDMLYYEGVSMKQMTNGERLYWIREFLYTADAYHRETATPKTFYLPAIWPCEPEPTESIIDKALQWLGIKSLPYPHHHIQYRCLEKILPYINYYANANSAGSPQNKPTMETSLSIQQSIIVPCYTKPQYKYNTVFLVSADMQYDIYHLFVYGKNKSTVYYDVAYIPNYKVSMFMNNIFRNIRENRNLDYIEESDDESDFQNVAEDKYVDLQKMVAMEFRFHPKFKRWVPLRVVEQPCKIAHISQV